MTNPRDLIVRAQRCRRLARGADPETERSLLAMAQELETKARLVLGEGRDDGESRG
jgi:hypothetical protein